MNPRTTTGPQRRASTDDAAARARLIEATAQIVASDGVQAATSRRITDEADMNLAAITFHFGSKQALLTEAMSTQVERWVEPALTSLEWDGDPSVRLLGAVQQLLQSFTENRDRSPAYLAALVEASHPGVDHEPTRAAIERIRGRLVGVLGDLVEHGTVPAWVEPEAMASLIVATANGIAMQCSLAPDGPSPEAQAAQLVQLFLAAGSMPGGAT